MATGRRAAVSPALPLKNGEVAGCLLPAGLKTVPHFDAWDNARDNARDRISHVTLEPLLSAG